MLLVNAASRRGRDAAGPVRAVLEAAGLGVVAPPMPARDALGAVIEAHAAEIDRVVLGGGDGTLNGAAAALRATGLPFGIIPLGTANDLARTLGIPSGIEAAARVAAAGRTRRIDLGEVNGVPFFNVASIGFGVDLARALTRDAKRRWGVLAYPVAALQALARLRTFRAEIFEGGRRHAIRTLHVAVGNGRHYGGGMTIAEHARIDDGRLDVYSLEVARLWRLLLLLPSLRSGRHRHWSEIRTLAGTDIAIRTRRPKAVNTDGEITTRTPATFRVLPAALEVFVPPDALSRPAGDRSA